MIRRCPPNPHDLGRVFNEVPELYNRVRLINTSHQVIMNGPSHRPNKRPKNPTDKHGKPPTR